MSRFLTATVCLVLLLAGLAVSPAKSEASGTYSKMTVRTVTGGMGYSSTAGTLSPKTWDLKTDTGTVSTQVTGFYWSTTVIYFTVDQCVFEDGKDLAGLMVQHDAFAVDPSHRQDCYSYQVPYDYRTTGIDSAPVTGLDSNINVEIFWPKGLYNVRLAQPIKMPAPVNVVLDSPVLLEGTGDPIYEVPFNWDYFAWSGSAYGYWHEVEWNGTVFPVGRNLGTFRSFSEPGAVTAKVRAAAACPEALAGCSVTVDGVIYTAPRGGILLSKWSPMQSVTIPIADDQYPTNVTEGEAPPAIVDALGAVFGAIGVQDPDAKAHLWSIFICLLLAIGLAAICVGSTGGGPASVFLGAVAFFLVFSLAGPPAFGVPGVFAGLALLVPSLGLVVFAKTKVR